jgi:uncharacterized membrane protein YgdD (TMEM256/DUF423 family)
MPSSKVTIDAQLMRARSILILTAMSGLLAVLLGAFASHGLQLDGRQQWLAHAGGVGLAGWYVVVLWQSVSGRHDAAYLVLAHTDRRHAVAGWLVGADHCCQ